MFVPPTLNELAIKIIGLIHLHFESGKNRSILTDLECHTCASLSQCLWAPLLINRNNVKKTQSTAHIGRKEKKKMIQLVDIQNGPLMV